MLGVFVDLLASELRRVIPGGGGAIPLHGRGDGLFEAPNGPPAEQAIRLLGRKVEERGFVRSTGLVPIQPTAGPMLQDFFDQFLDRAVRIQSRAEVKGAAQFGGAALRPKRWPNQNGGQPQVSTERLENMLPRAGRILVANRYRFAVA